MSDNLSEISGDEIGGDMSDEEMATEEVRGGRGTDNLGAPMDIPLVDDIPVVSKLAKMTEK